MAIELIDKVAPKNDGFVGMVDAKQVIGSASNGLPDSAVAESNVTQHQSALSVTASQVSDFDTEVSNNTSVASNTTHKTSNGSDHTYINQDVRTTASPTFSTIYASNDIVVTDDATIGDAITAGSYIQSKIVDPRQNLGNPTVTEMALFEEEFSNKTAFYNIAEFTYESYDGSTWTDISATISDENKKRLVGGDTNACVIIPYETEGYRITIRNDNSYCWLNALYMYISSSGHDFQVNMQKKRDDGSWIDVTTNTKDLSTWPGHVYMPFPTILWKDPVTSGSHYETVRIEITPTWNGSYPSNDITLGRLQLWGGYPNDARRVFSIDEEKNVTFPADVTIETNVDVDGTFNVDGATTLSNTTIETNSNYPLNVKYLGTGSYLKAFNILAQDMVDGNSVQFSVGKTLGTNQAFEFTFYNKTDAADNYVAMGLYGSQTFYLHNDRIGIQTSSPDYDLDVSGSARVTSEFYVGSELGIGTTSPGCELHIVAATPEMCVESNTANAAIYRMVTTDTEYHFETASSKLRFVETGVDYPFVINDSPGSVEINRKLETSGNVEVAGHVECDEFWFDSSGDYKIIKNGTSLEVWVQGVKVQEWGN